jgi:excisionase family DNA binding protein
MTRTHTPDPATIEAIRTITAKLPADGSIRLEGTPLPGPVAAMLREVLDSLAAGEPVAIITKDSELTPNEAADLLNVSRGTVTKMMDEGFLPFRLVGTHRRIPGAAVAARKAELDRQGQQAMAELAKHEQDMGLDDLPPMPPKRLYRNGGRDE